MNQDGSIERARKRVGANVRRLRVRAQLTQEALAGQVGLGWRHIQKIEAGEVNVTLATISRLASALSVDPAVLLMDAATEAPNAED